MYKKYGKNMRYYKPQKGDEDYAKSESAYPFVLIVFRRGFEDGKTKNVRIVVNGSYQENKADIDKKIEKLTSGVPEEKFILTVLFFKSEKDWEKVIQLGKFTRHITIR